jgi:hypothetical protein
MNQVPQLDRIIKRIQSAMVALEDVSPETARKALRNLLDEIISEFEGQPGMQTIVLSIASGDIRHLERDDSDELFDEWNAWVEERHLQSNQVSEEDVRSASKRILGREDAFVYIR